MTFPLLNLKRGGPRSGADLGEGSNGNLRHVTFDMPMQHAWALLNYMQARTALVPFLTAEILHTLFPALG